jgi:hypothetical protein
MKFNVKIHHKHTYALFLNTVCESMITDRQQCETVML